MAKRRSFRRYVEQELGKFPHFVIYAFLEWTLMLILFIDGFLAFFANEFAKFFELKLPCLLCTRIDHVIAKRNRDFYYNESICEVHKKDISYLAYCRFHGKLSNFRKMCEKCLTESDINTHKSNGILHKGTIGIDEKNEDKCSCCGDKLKAKSSYPKETIQGSSNRRSLLSSQIHAPLSSPRTPYSSLRNEISDNMELPHIHYRKLKFMSHNDSEIVDDDDMTPRILGKEEVTTPLLRECEDLNEDQFKSPNFSRFNKFFGIPLTDSPSSSPRTLRTSLRKSLLEKTEYATESSTSLSDPNSTMIDGESILHRLKRQVRLDRKSLIALYMELDEERSASAVAANNAMAMITRLQAEKAAGQMEALQYQRMMEEQEEYDQEALEVMNEFLAKKDEEIWVLESELEVYRERYGNLRDSCCDGDVDVVAKEEEFVR